MFSFAFDLDGDLSPAQTSTPAKGPAPAPAEGDCLSRTRVEKVSPREAASYEELERVALQVGDSLTLQRVTSNPTTFPEGYKPTHDVVSGKYEGGLKIWECSLDLVEYLSCDEMKSLQNGDDEDRHYKILELGCGQGFPGIVCLKKINSCSVVFTDLNAEVLAETTWPNIFLNCNPEKLAAVECVAGDWDSFSQSMILQQTSDEGGQTPRQFDVILSAETLYTAASCRGVLRILKAHLSPNGFALLATKRFYFGLGGGLREFEVLVAADGALDCRVVKSWEDGKSTVRDIIRVSKRS